MNVFEKGKALYQENKGTVKKVGALFGTIFTCSFISYFLGYNKGAEKADRYEKGLVMMTLADPTLLEHLDSAGEKARKTLSQL